MGNASWLLFLLIAIQFKSSSQQLTFARSWVRGEFANDEDGGGNQDYDSNINQPQSKKANKAFYMRASAPLYSWPHPWLKDSLQSDLAPVLPEENTISTNNRFPNWNCQFPHFYRYITRSRDITPFRHPHV